MLVKYAIFLDLLRSLHELSGACFFIMVRACVMAGVVGLAAALSVGGCSLPARQELPVPVEISIAASESLNPTEQGRPSPVLLRIYELSGRAFFQSADFFTLLGEMESARHAEVIEIHEFVLMPGEVRVMRRRTELGTQFLGVAAAYRDLQGSSWRSLASVPPPHRAGRLWSSETSPERRYRVVVGERSVAIDEVGR
ncbi:type VI secretion system lipoprotein TssJ [Thauera butanivorans]|uniref:type VI secretion system lipoprotein TssJ n=1 Tax=Thauera butanivorans TaxID=86174 RepID=UPI0008393963|nr:type VI secretion system lipoprotein TssJ [Thauera butanivorans]